MAGDENVYAEAGSAFKKLVEPGYHFISTKVPPMECKAGTYWDYTNSKMECEVCRKGYFCPDPVHGVEIACPKGTTAVLTGQSACDPCPAGFYCAASDPDKDPVECDDG